MVGKLAPAQFGEEPCGVALARFAGGRGLGNDTSDGMRTDFAEVQVRRKPRGVVPVGPVPEFGVAVQAAFHEGL